MQRNRIVRFRDPVLSLRQPAVGIQLIRRTQNLFPGDFQNRSLRAVTPAAALFVGLATLVAVNRTSL